MTNGWLWGRGEGDVNQEGGVGHPDRHLDERCLDSDWISKDGVPRRLQAGEPVSRLHIQPWLRAEKGENPGQEKQGATS